MKTFNRITRSFLIRAVLTGAFLWLCIFCTFGILDAIPGLEGEVDTQAIIVAILIIPFAVLGAFIYYKNDRTPHGLLVGFIIALTALVLDALITVPLVEIPKGNSYEDFFTYPLLWLLIVINIATVYIYWRLKLMQIK